MNKAFSQLDRESYIRELLHQLGEDPTRDGLVETPHRFLQALQEYTEGYYVEPEKFIKVFDGDNYDEMVFVGSIPVWSLCEHHLAPFFGIAHVAYIPQSNRIIGLSKIPRIVNAFARRISVQERITTQVADLLFCSKKLKPLGTAVVLQCRHTCMEMRGVRSFGATTTTSAIRGVFSKNESARSEFMDMVKAATK